MRHAGAYAGDGEYAAWSRSTAIPWMARGAFARAAAWCWRPATLPGAELKAHFMGPQEAKVEGVNVTATGDGQRMAEAVGARIVNGDLALGPEIRFIAPATETLVRRLPPWRWLAIFMQWSQPSAAGPAAPLHDEVPDHGAGAVDHAVRSRRAAGQPARRARFGSELDQPAWRLPDQPGKVGYILIDGRLARDCSRPGRISCPRRRASPTPTSPDYRRNRPDVYTQAPTLARSLRRRTRVKPELGMDAAGALVAAARPPAAYAHWVPDPMWPWGRCARSSCTARAAWRSTSSTACSAPMATPCRVCMRPAPPARVGCCSRATAITWPGPSSRAGAQGGMRRSAGRRRPRSSRSAEMWSISL